MKKKNVGANFVRPNGPKEMKKITVGVGVPDDPKQRKNEFLETRINSLVENKIVGTSIARPHSPNCNSNGITLVSLVITIIIMLILARSNHKSNSRCRNI